MIDLIVSKNCSTVRHDNLLYVSSPYVSSITNTRCLIDLKHRVLVIPDVEFDTVVFDCNPHMERIVEEEGFYFNFVKERISDVSQLPFYIFPSVSHNVPPVKSFSPHIP